MRARECVILIKKEERFGTVCVPCKRLCVTTKIEFNRKRSKLQSPTSSKASLIFVSPDHLRATIKQQKLTIRDKELQCNQLKETMKEMQNQISLKSCEIDNQLENDIIDIFKGISPEKVSQFIRIFWEEQQKCLQTTSKSQLRYHLMVIKYCLAVFAKSPSAYRELRYKEKNESGTLTLPSEQILRDYRNCIKLQ